MEIILKVGATDYTLCAGDAHGVDLHVGPLDGGSNDLRNSLQVDPIIEATHQKVRDRANKLGRYSFGVQVEKSSIAEALVYELTYANGIPAAGDIWITQDTRRIKLLGCGIESIRASRIGVAVFITYSVTYGAITSETLTP